MYWLNEIPQQTIAQKPIYTASLTRQSPGWTTHQPTTSDPINIAFINGSYQLSTSDLSTYAIS